MTARRSSATDRAAATLIPAVNGIDAGGLRDYIALIREDSSLGERSPTAVARWVGGDRSQVECDGATISLGGAGNFSPMKAVLAALAACDVDVVATHAALLGVEIESLAVEATGHFDVRSYLGFTDAPGSGFHAISYIVRVTAPGAPPEQIRLLRERCQQSSPVGDSLARAIPLRLRFEAGANRGAIRREQQ